MTTRPPLTEAEKVYLAEQRAAGATYPDIARDLGCAVVTVRKHARRQRDHQGPRARGRAARGILSTYPAEWVERAVAVKRVHPHGGQPMSSWNSNGSWTCPPGPCRVGPA